MLRQRRMNTSEILLDVMGYGIAWLWNSPLHCAASDTKRIVEYRHDSISFRKRRTQCKIQNHWAQYSCSYGYSQSKHQDPETWEIETTSNAAFESSWHRTITRVRRSRFLQGSKAPPPAVASSSCLRPKAATRPAYHEPDPSCSHR